MHILNNGRFGMAAALSGTMKGLIMRAVSSFYTLGNMCQAFFHLACMQAGFGCSKKTGIRNEVAILDSRG